MTEEDRITVLLYQLLFHEETAAQDGCDFSLEVLKRNPIDEGACLKHYENCVRLRMVKMMTAKLKETLDIFRPRGV